MFTHDQEKIILQQPANTVVFAAPGSGKTTVLTHHILHLLESGNLHPRDIMAMTFTKQSAQDMRERLSQTGRLSHKSAQVLRIGTFHAQLFRILLQQSPNIPVLLSATEQYKLMSEAVESHSIRRSRVTKEEVQHYLNLLTRRCSIYPPLPLKGRKRRIIDTYQRLKNNTGRWDFDDILVTFCDFMFSSRFTPESLKSVQYLLIDEFQDTNSIQWLIVEEWANRLGIPVFVVGDDDQSIYGFRGASPRWLLDFSSRLPNVRQYILKQNFRSTRDIVCNATQLIENNRLRASKDMIASREEHGEIRAFAVKNEACEAKAVADKVRHLHELHPEWSFAVLARTRRQLYGVWQLISDFEHVTVQLRTFHDAKGKEWDAVFIVGLVDDNPYLLARPETPEELEEERRLYYVALTRAKNLSYTFCPGHVLQKKSLPSPFVCEAGLNLEY